jgi:hypothetical protein
MNLCLQLNTVHDVSNLVILLGYLIYIFDLLKAFKCSVFFLVCFEKESLILLSKLIDMLQFFLFKLI